MILLALALRAAMPVTLACAVCGGDADGDQVRAARLGVLVLLSIVVVLLASIAWVLRGFAKRARALEEAR